MKRLVASRRLKVRCLECDCGFKRGDVYYKKRHVYAYDFDKSIETFNEIICSRCKYDRDDHKIRFERFKDNCQHPEGFTETVWSYIPGEFVMQPDHDECTLCGKYV